MGGLSDLIEALTILRKYGDPGRPTHCEHDELMVCDINPELVSLEDHARLRRLGFFVAEESGDAYFKSFRFGSA